MKTPVTGSAVRWARPLARVTAGFGVAGVGPATDVGADGGTVVLWRDHNAAPAATSRTTTRTAIVHQGHQRRATFRSDSITGSDMRRMLHAEDPTHRPDRGARRPQTPAR